MHYFRPSEAREQLHLGISLPMVHVHWLVDTQTDQFADLCVKLRHFPTNDASDTRHRLRRNLYKLLHVAYASNWARAASMPIRKYIAGAAFDPDSIARMNAAFEKACAILNVGHADPLFETVAKKIVSLASQGVTDPNEMWRRVVADTDLEPR